MKWINTGLSPLSVELTMNSITFTLKRVNIYILLLLLLYIRIAEHQVIHAVQDIKIIAKLWSLEKKYDYEMKMC